MAGPTTERLDEDLRVVREDVASIRTTGSEQAIRLAEIGTKLGEVNLLRGDIGSLRDDVKELSKQVQALAVNSASLTSRVNTVIAMVAGFGSIFGLAVVTAGFNGNARLAELQTNDRVFEQRLTEMRESISRHQTDAVPDLDERISRAVRASVDAAVDAAVKRAGIPRP